MLVLNIFILAIIAIGIIQCLNPSDVTEGSCITKPVASNFDVNWFNKPGMWSISGGSKYHLYRIAAGYPEFSNLREFEFYYDSCLQVFFDFPGGNVTVYGFGESIGRYDFTVIGPGIVEYSAEPPVPGAGEKIISRITLTDNKTFAFSTMCFSGQNQKGWVLFTISPEIVTPQLQKKIEDYAVSLGYNRENFAFLRYYYCKHLFGQGVGYGWR